MRELTWASLPVRNAIARAFHRADVLHLTRKIVIDFIDDVIDFIDHASSIKSMTEIDQIIIDMKKPGSDPSLSLQE